MFGAMLVVPVKSNEGEVCPSLPPLELLTYKHVCPLRFPKAPKKLMWLLAERQRMVPKFIIL